MPITTAHRTRSGRRIAHSCTIDEPSESPTSATGGVHVASISSSRSSENDDTGHGSGRSHTVSPTPRQSYVVHRNDREKWGIWYGCQSPPRDPPPETNTTSGPSPNVS